MNCPVRRRNAKSVPGRISVTGIEPGICRVQWGSTEMVSVLDLGGLPLPGSRRQPLALDLLDLASASCLASVAGLSSRGSKVARPLVIELSVRELDFWRAADGVVRSLLSALGETVEIDFRPIGARCLPARQGHGVAQCSDVCLLSGGLDSLCCGGMLLRQERCPRFITLGRSGCGSARAQRTMATSLRRCWPIGFQAAHVTLDTCGGIGPHNSSLRAAPLFSGRSLPLLLMALGAVAAMADRAESVYLCDSDALPVDGEEYPDHRSCPNGYAAGPLAVSQFNQLLRQAGWTSRIVNPFLLLPKGELIRNYLVGGAGSDLIRRSVSCCQSGRMRSHCGRCRSCLLRRIALRAAGLPEGRYQSDLLERPTAHRGTAAYGTLIRLLLQVRQVLDTPVLELPWQFPWLFDAAHAGLDVLTAARALHSQATEISTVLHEQFPECAALLGGPGVTEVNSGQSGSDQGLPPSGAVQPLAGNGPSSAGNSGNSGQRQGAPRRRTSVQPTRSPQRLSPFRGPESTNEAPSRAF